MNPLEDYVTAYGINPENLIVRYLVFPDNPETELLDIYYRFLQEHFKADDFKSLNRLTKSMREKFVFITHTTISGDRIESKEYSSAISFSLSELIKPGRINHLSERNNHLNEFVNWLCEKEIPVAEKIPLKMSDDMKYNLYQIKANGN